ncbi:MAG TPA: M48 family metalloprotease [Pyrinomonadaceae bacterium]|jgi:Zn-dependent protease with chaperone function|nr:M48 family metalloprotease [Pyrinomonadaceae bacterium]
MNSLSRPRRFRLLCLLLLASLISGAVAEARAAGGDEEPQEEETFASVNVRVDERGAARVRLLLAFRPDEAATLRQSLVESLGFPLEVDGEHGDFDEEEDAFWWSLDAHNDHAFKREGLASGRSIEMSPLVNALRPHGVRNLSLVVFFDAPPGNLHVTGANKVALPGLYGSSGRRRATEPQTYTALINMDEAAPPPVRFSWGYSPSDILVQLTPLYAFVLLPVLLTLWMSRSALKKKGAGPLAIWGSYFRYLYLLINAVWLIWLPVYSLANIGDMLSAGGGGGGDLFFEVIGLSLYFLPPLLVLYLCHLLSRKVYREVSGAEWSPREVMGKAILQNAASLMPLFFLILAVNMFAARSRYALLLLIVAIICWALFALFASKAFNLSAYAVTAGELRDRVFALAERAGVPLQQIYVLPDGAGQLTNAFARSDNAVLLTGSLLRHLSKREVDAIMAHEIGHLKEKHPQTLSRATVAVILISNLIVAAASTVVNLQRWSPALFSLSIAVALLVTRFLSRSNERHADSIAIDLTRDPEAFIKGLAKMSRLNLMPLHAGGGWTETLNTHPATMRRLEDVAGCGGISTERLKELLDSADEEAAAADRYIHEAAPDTASEKVFSSAFKSKNIFRISWAMLATVIAPPVLLALINARLQPRGVYAWAAFALGLGLTFALYLTVRNFAAFWGYDSLERRVRARLKGSGVKEATGHDHFVGFAPDAEPRLYENYLLWDAGILRLSAEGLCYLGEETRFSLRREQVVDIYLGDSQPLWLRQKHLYVRWRDDERGARGTFYLLAGEARSLLQARRKVRSLHRELRDWKERAAAYPADSEALSSLSSPGYGGVTGQPMRERFTRRTFLVSTFQLVCFTLVLSVGARLPLWGVGYALGIVVGTSVLDQLPRLWQHVSEKRSLRAAIPDSPADTLYSQAETPAAPPGGALAESKT